MKNIYVGNLSFDATEDQVRSLFEAYGPVDKVSIVTDRDTGKPRGFAFDEMTDDELAGEIDSDTLQLALLDDESEIDGDCNESQPCRGDES